MKPILPMILLGVMLSASAFAQTSEDAQQAIHNDEQALATDNQEIRELDRQRNEALRVKNFAAASRLQAEMDQKRAAIRKTESSLGQQKNEEREQCDRDPQCVMKKKREELTRALDAAHGQLAADEAAAARVPADKAEIDRIEAALRQ